MVSIHNIIERGITSGAGFQRVKKVIDNFIQRKRIVHFHPGRIQIFHILEHPAAFLAKLHDIPHKIDRGQNIRLDHRLPRFRNGSYIRIIARVVDVNGFPGSKNDLINYRRGSRYQVKVKLPLQPFLDNFHVQQS